MWLAQRGNFSHFREWKLPLGSIDLSTPCKPHHAMLLITSI